MLISILSISQSGYPKLINSIENNDTLVILSIENIKTLNNMRVDMLLCQEMSDSLISNFYQLIKKEKLCSVNSMRKSEIIKYNELIINDKNLLINKKNDEIKKLHKTNNFTKIGGAILIILALLI
jgi:hypothetical protein